MNVVLSAIIPTYNQARFLPESIGSVLAQSLEEVEAIVVNDGSNDDTAAVLAEYQDHPKVRVIHQDNRGTAAARNIAIAAAQGRYIAMLDGDDRWDPRKAEKQVGFMEAHPEIDLSYSWCREVDVDGKPNGIFHCAGEMRPSFDSFFLSNFTHTTSVVMFRRALVDELGGFKASLPIASDHEMWLRIAARRENNVACHGEVLTDYRIWTGQKSYDWRRMLNGWNAMMAELKSLYPGPYARLETKARALNRKHLAFNAMRSGDDEGARQCLAEALTASPRTVFSNRGWLTMAAIATSALPGGLSGQLLRLVAHRRKKNWCTT